MKGIIIWIAVYILWVAVFTLSIEYFSLETTVVTGIAMLQADKVLNKYNETKK